MFLTRSDITWTLVLLENFLYKYKKAEADTVSNTKK